MIHRRSLIVCMTPLHVFTARLLVKHNGASFSEAIYLAQFDNNKGRHYSAELHSLADVVHYRVMEPEEKGAGLHKYVAIWRRRRRFNKWLRGLGQFDTIYVPSSLSDYLYAVVAQTSFSVLKTYDDGLLNINPESQILTQPVSRSSKIFLLMCGVNEWPERIIKRSVEHFSTYTVSNIYARVTALKWDMDRGHQIDGSIARHEIILIGTAPEASQQVRAAIMQFDVEQSPTWYLRHPRDTEAWTGNSKLLETPLIAEDYVMCALHADSCLRFSVVGYESSAL